MIKLKRLVRPSIISLALFLGACASGIQHLVINPDVLIPSNTLFAGKSINLNTGDLRTAQHMLQIIKEGKAAELVTSQSSLAQLVDNALSSAFKKSGAQLGPTGNNVLNIVISKALINVNQSMMKYNANNSIELSISVDNGLQTLTKSYRSSGKSEGPFKADIAVLERDFNQQLSKLITNIINDPELINFMR